MQRRAESGAQAAPIEVVVHEGADALEDLSAEWRSLCAEGPCDVPFLRPSWLAAHVSAFEAPAAVRLVAARREGRLRGILPLIEDRGPFHGIPVRRLRSASGVHAGRFDLIHGDGDRDEVAAAMFRALQERGGFELLELRDVPEGGAAEALVRAAAEAGHPTGRWESMRTPFVPLPGRPSDGASALAGTDAKFRANLRRRERKLAALGPLTHRRVTAADPEVLAHFYALERAGWKGARGTAIVQDPRTRAFYDRIAAAGAEEGWLSLRLLLAGARVVAAHFGLEHRGRYYLPKPAYDPEVRGCSPGQLLVRMVLEDGAERGLAEFDFLGPWMDWKADWTSQVRPHAFLYVFAAGARGRVLHDAKFRAAPAVRRILSRGRLEMEATAHRTRERLWSGPAVGTATFAPALPSLRTAMALPRAMRATPFFPLDQPGLSTFYLARNGIYALAKLWGLEGSEVLFPAYFHGVELEALIEAGVQPRFYPVHARMRVDPDDVRRRIGPQTRAVYLTHFAGFPGPVEELRALCDEHGLRLIEDCALALLSRIGERPLGSFGDAAIFCFYKTLPVPNGGGLLLRRPDPIALPEALPPPLASTMAHAAGSWLSGLEARTGLPGHWLRQAARGAGRTVSRATRAERVPTGTQRFERSHVGLGMSRWSFRIALAQDAAAIVERRRRNYFHLLGRLRDASPPLFSELPPGVCPLFFPLQVRDKSSVLRRIVARGVESVDFWRLGHAALPPGAFPAVDALRETILEVPCHQDLSPRAIDRVADVVRAALNATERP